MAAYILLAAPVICLLAGIIYFSFILYKLNKSSTENKPQNDSTQVKENDYV